MSRRDFFPRCSQLGYFLLLNRSIFFGCAGKRQGFSARGASRWLLECSPARALQVDLRSGDACAGAMKRWIVMARRGGKTFAVRSVRLFRGQTKWMVRGVEAWNSAGLHAVRQADVPSDRGSSDNYFGLGKWFGSASFVPGVFVEGYKVEHFSHPAADAVAVFVFQF